jgi:hypothetical protein
MGAIKNWLINHPEAIEDKRFDEGYKYRQIEEEKEWQEQEEEIEYLNTLLANDAYENLKS